MVTPTELAQHMNAVDDTDTLPSLQRAIDAALVLLGSKLGGIVPSESVMDWLTLEVATNIYRRKDSPNNVSQYAQFDGPTQVRTPNDPIQTVWPVLRSLGVRPF